MGDSGNEPASSWLTAGSSSNSVHMLYEQADEDEPSSSIPVSSSSDYNPVSTASFVPSSYRSQPVFQANERYAADAYNVQGSSVSGHIYQAAESSYQSGQDVQPDQYADIIAVGNEAQMQIYNNISDSDNSFAASQPVASSSVADTGYSVPHMLVDGMIVDAQDSRVTVGLQRVISPDVDSTVSQSINCIPITHRLVTEGDTSAPRPSGSNSTMMHIRISQTQSEVSTSGESVSQGNIGHRHGDNEIGHRDIDTIRHGEVEAGPSGSAISGFGRNSNVMEPAVSSRRNVDVMEPAVSSRRNVNVMEPAVSSRRNVDVMEPAVSSRRNIDVMEPAVSSRRNVDVMEPAVSSRRNVDVMEPAVSSRRNVNVMEPAVSSRRNVDVMEPAVSSRRNVDVLEPAASSRRNANVMEPAVSSRRNVDGMEPAVSSRRNVDVMEPAVSSRRNVDGMEPDVSSRRNVDVMEPAVSSRRNVYVMEPAISSITGSVSNEAEVTLRNPSKTDGRSLDDIVSGEPDTTQADEDEGHFEQDEIEDSSSIDHREEDLSTHMLPLDQPHPSSSSNVVDSTQMMATALPVSNSIASANQIPVSNLATNYIAVNIGDYQEQMQVAPQAQLTANEIALGQITANQLSASMESQLSQAAYILDASTVDSNTKVQQSDLGLQLANFMSARGLRIDQGIDQPGTSTDNETFPKTSSNSQIGGSAELRRKSSRIACLDHEESSWRKPEYVPSTYDPNQLWCEECMQGYDTECDIHKLSPHPDKVVFSRAWASLPTGLQIFKLTQDRNDLGVFTKRMIPKRTQFGPFIADLVPDDQAVRRSFPLMIERHGSTLYYDTSDENKCNWMMFVRPADTYAEQNIVAYQYENDIYFTVTKEITEPKTELKVWYAAHYAARWNKSCLKATKADLQAIEEQMCKFQCYECPKRFRTAAALQKHLIAHDSDPLKGGTIEEPSSSQSTPPPTKRSRKSLAPQHSLRRKYMANKKEAGQLDNSANASGIYHWKKRSTNIYLNKTLKKYHKRHESELMRKSALSSQQMMMKDGATSESGEVYGDWECGSCDFVFTNATLLNLHVLSHTEDSTEDAKLAYQLESLLGTTTIVDQVQISCPGCPQQFYNKKDLVAHVNEHGVPKPTGKYNTDYHEDIMTPVSTHRPHRCGVCLKSFTSVDRLAKHHQCHGDESQKPFQCSVCHKRFINNSAMSCHMKTHSSAKYYQCPICHLGFDQTTAMREHSLIHANANGSFNCPHCDKVFVEFLVLKKHVRGFHTNRTYPCEQCDKVFPRADKLRLHMLRHSSVREFMCDTCGRQFKRKDKLKEHIKRMHSVDREEKDRMKAMRPHAKRFIPKVSPTEYHRFIYKCHLCLLGFKRRGMLVNHIAKRHPDLKPESVPELNLPILKTQRDYYCQYCDKVYKSSSKRKSHILKNHPGSELPQSARKKSTIDEIPGVPNPTYSQTVGSITTMPHQCEHCHKQYASKAKLLQHQRKHHPEFIPHLERLKRDLGHQAVAETATTFVVESAGDTTDSQAADLLTQAMSELTQSVEFRQISGQPGEQAYLATRIGQGAPTMVQIQTSGGHGTQTIELAHLSQALQHFAPPQGHLPIQVQVSNGVTGQIQIPITTSQAGTTAPGTHILTVDQMPGSDTPQAHAVSTTQAQQLNFLPISIASGAYIPKNWNNYTQYKTH